MSDTCNRRVGDLDRLVTELHELSTARSAPVAGDTRIAITRKAGSFTLEESLARLVHGGSLNRGDAMLRAAHPEELESLLRAV